MHLPGEVGNGSLWSSIPWDEKDIRSDDLPMTNSIIWPIGLRDCTTHIQKRFQIFSLFQVWDLSTRSLAASMAIDGFLGGIWLFSIIVVALASSFLPRNSDQKTILHLVPESNIFGNFASFLFYLIKFVLEVIVIALICHNFYLTGRVGDKPAPIWKTDILKFQGPTTHVV